ncbi:uncharacterized protein AC631_05721 [Debaryomyces fabryi]|uniref:U3 small nucleolar ribonucleoprotein protein MPP10 n=1 Tax=Debaryomyces fabryi TaxID=58627 RepID=A0A0V1PQV4_9ASCO|nr:uncharacterized protein AC631_05721 [Debaryomyces fabryi]KRZ98521.1 hypothetical protein AC631_05721 [Debaryomyces fabryi]CUM57062.1 unnamed protein product [Debaryomyces fabryi]
MPQDILSVLEDNPQKVFGLFKSESQQDSGYFNELIKTFLDPITKEYSVLDKVYVDGLDSTQVYGQTKIVLEGACESLLFDKIPKLKEEHMNHDSDEEVSESDDEDKQQQNETDDQEEENQSDSDSHAEIVGQSEDDVQTLNEDDEESENFKGDEDSENETQVPSDDEEIHPPKKDAFGLNDEFFDIDSFNKQILALENTNNADDEEEIDFFGDLGDDDEDDEQMEYFDDFYEKPGKVNTSRSSKGSDHEEKNEDGEDDEDEDEIEIDEDVELNEDEYDNAVGSAMLDLFDDENQKPKDTENLSSYQKQQQQIQAEIAALESELVADKKWTMKGEIASKDRPQDSLLDDPESASLEFDRTSKPVPVITQEVTESIEDLIKRRIKEGEFDDLPKRIITDISKFHNRQKFELSEQKSSKSLAEIYEDQYNNVDENKEVSEELQKQHDEISELFTKVTHKLDSLCSAHFIPKPHQMKTIDIKVSDAASISMEDAQPLHVSNETTLAPQEIYKIGDDKPAANGAKGRSEVLLKSGLSYSKDELSREDKQRLRRANKRKKSKHFNERKEYQEQKQKQDTTSSNNNKRQKVSDVVNTLSNAKNVTIIDKKGELRDAKGNIRKSQKPKGSSGFKL